MPLPRSVGMAARAQLALVDLAFGCGGQELHARLAPQMPAGCPLARVTAPLPAVTPQAQRATFEVPVDAGDAPGLAERIAALLALETVPVEREFGPRRPTQQVDIRPYIDETEWDGRALRVHLKIAAQRSARPSEVLTKLGLSAESYAHRLWRTAVQWNNEPWRGLASPAATTEKAFEQQEDPSQRSQDDS
jgi:hypothetical protein